MSRFVPFIARWAITAAAVWVAAAVLPGIWVAQPHRIWTILLVALVLGLVNAFLRPIVSFLSCGLIILTLGLFTLLINGFMLWLAVKITDAIGLSFHVDGFWNYVGGALIIGIVSALLSYFVGKTGIKQWTRGN